MARPRKFYIIYRDGQAVSIAHGLAETKKKGTSYGAFPTRLAAEEFAMWWNHEHVPWWLAAPRNKAPLPTTPTA